MRDPALLRAALERSGMEKQDFARLVLLRPERTVRRWERGEYPLPPAVRAYLEKYLLTEVK